MMPSKDGRRGARVHCDDRHSADEGGGRDRTQRLALRVAHHVRHSGNDVFDVRLWRGADLQCGKGR